MIKDTQPIAIVGSGGLGKKVKWLIDRINSREYGKWINTRCCINRLKE